MLGLLWGAIAARSSRRGLRADPARRRGCGYRRGVQPDVRRDGRASRRDFQLPPEVLGEFPPGTLFTVDRIDGTVMLIAAGTDGLPRMPDPVPRVPD